MVFTSWEEGEWDGTPITLDWSSEDAINDHMLYPYIEALRQAVLERYKIANSSSSSPRLDDEIDPDKIPQTTYIVSEWIHAMVHDDLFVGGANSNFFVDSSGDWDYNFDLLNPLWFAPPVITISPSNENRLISPSWLYSYYQLLQRMKWSVFQPTKYGNLNNALVTSTGYHRHSPFEDTWAEAVAGFLGASWDSNSGACCGHHYEYNSGQVLILRRMSENTLSLSGPLASLSRKGYKVFGTMTKPPGFVTKSYINPDYPAANENDTYLLDYVDTTPTYSDEEGVGSLSFDVGESNLVTLVEPGAPISPSMGGYQASGPYIVVNWDVAGGLVFR